MLRRSYGQTRRTELYSRKSMKHLKIKSLEKGWCDRDDLILHAAFQRLADFVEKELTPGNPFNRLIDIRTHLWT
jgi:hypothetical protein